MHRSVMHSHIMRHIPGSAAAAAAVRNDVIQSYQTILYIRVSTSQTAERQRRNDNDFRNRRTSPVAAAVVWLSTATIPWYQRRSPGLLAAVAYVASHHHCSPAHWGYRNRTNNAPGRTGARNVAGNRTIWYVVFKSPGKRERRTADRDGVRNSVCAINSFCRLHGVK